MTASSRSTGPKLSISVATPPSSSLPKLLDKAQISALVIANIFKYLSDTDLSSLAVNNELAERTLSDSRWIEKLQRVLFNGFYLNFLINQLGNGKSILDIPQIESTDETKEESREMRIRNQVNLFLGDMKQQGIHHFQTIYARYRKSRYLKMNTTLNEDQFILLSRHDALIKKWLAQNRNKVLRNEPLDLEGSPAIFYLALSGYREGLHFYNQLGFDFTVTDTNGDSIQACIGLSGSVSTLDYCAHELKIDMTKTVGKKKLMVQHAIARSGSDAALEYSKDHLKSSIKALSTDKVAVQHMAAASGNPRSIWICQNKFKLPMEIVSSKQQGMIHFAGISGSRAVILMCAEMKLDMNLKHDGQGVEHCAAASGKRQALEVCKELNLDMTLYTKKGLGLQHFAAIGGRETLRFCRDNGFDMQAEVKDEQKKGIQHILAVIGKPEDFIFCSELGLDIDKLDARGDGFEIYAAQGGNSSALRFFKNSGRNFRSNTVPKLGVRGVQHAAAQGGDPLTILTCAEYGLDMKEEPGVSFGAELYAAKSGKPAALLLMQLLGLPIDQRVRELAKQSENHTMSILAQLMSHHHAGGHPYPLEIKKEWDKIVFENRTEHVAAFFLEMSKKKNVGIFSDGFSLSKEERKILKQLPYQMQAMKEENLARVYIYLNYLHLNLVTSKKITYEQEATTFTAIIRYAIDQVLNKIYELKEKALLENANNTSKGNRAS